MRRNGLANFAAALALAAILAAPTDANASHRSRHHAGAAGSGAYAVSVPPRRVAAFRRAHVDRFIGPSGTWIDKKHYYYRPYHYWRGPLVYSATPAYRRHLRGVNGKFICKDTPYGVVCREPL